MTFLAYLLLVAQIETVSQEARAQHAPQAIDQSAGLAPGAESVAASLSDEGAKEQALATMPLEEFEVRGADQVWMMSSRQVRSLSSPVETLSIERRTRDDRWSDASLYQFLASNNDGIRRRTIIYIHGNQTTHQKALRDGLATYDQTFLEWEKAPPVRFVIWSWPSSKVTRGLRDVRLKARYAELHALHLARLLGRMESTEQVSLIGYSYGGRLSINALHLLGGGTVQGCSLTTDQQTPKVNLTLVAAAIRNDCFCNQHWRALTKIDHLFLLYNSRDQYLRFYKLARFDGGIDAIGFTGLRSMRHGLLPSSQITQFDAASRVGREHTYLEYVVDRRVEQLIRKNLFADLPPRFPSSAGAAIKE